MKTLTARLAVAALLVAGVVQAVDQATPVLSTGMVMYHANRALQNAAGSWQANQNVNKATRAKKAFSAVKNYGLPLLEVTTAAWLAARANGHACVPAVVNTAVNESCLKALNSQVAAMVALTAFSAGTYYYDNFTPAEQAFVAAAEASAEQAYAQATAPSTDDSKAKARK